MHARATQAEPDGHHRGASRQGLHLHFAPTTGIAGDMAVAALVDVGVPEGVVLEAVHSMHVPGLNVGFHVSPDIAGRHFIVSWATPHRGYAHDHLRAHSPAAHGRHDHRPYAEIRRMLQNADLPKSCRTLAEKMFACLASVEARIHGQPVEDVTFHEVGAYDSIADIVGVAAAVAWLAPSSISASAPMVGHGTVECAHGTLPVPAPATASLLSGYSTLDGGEGELTTPTGALVLTSLVDQFGPPPPLRVVAQGSGIGTRRLHGRPNAMTVVLGEIVEANL
jgi:pyridinium-3,5-bisthiocarboxylic acid mononucleotide nickel chelatase